MWNFFCNSIFNVLALNINTIMKFNVVIPNAIIFKTIFSLNTAIITKFINTLISSINISYIAYLTYFLYLIIVIIDIAKFETIVTIGKPIVKDHFLNPNIKSIKNSKISI